MNTPSVPNTPLAEYPLPQWTSVTPSSAMEVRPAKGGLVASNSAISTATQSCPKRQIRACDFCHKRKTKCDGGHPCDHCSRLNVSCVYSRTEKRRGPRGGYTEGLQRRVHELTLILEERGIEYAQPYYSVHPEPPSILPSAIYTNASTPQSPGVGFIPELHLPLIGYFFGYIAPICPLVHRKWFMSTLVPTNQHRPYFTNAIYLVSIRFALAHGDLSEHRLTEEREQLYFNRLMSQLSCIYKDKVLEGVITFLYLALYAYSIDDMQLAWNMSGCASRMALGLRLNVDPLQLPCCRELPWVMAEMRRRTWWCCFLMVMNKHPCMLQWHQSSVLAPVAFDEFESADPHSLVEPDGCSGRQDIHLNPDFANVRHLDKPFFDAFPFLIIMAHCHYEVILFVKKPLVSNPSLGDNVRNSNEREQLLSRLELVFSQIPQRHLQRENWTNQAHYSTTQMVDINCLFDSASTLLKCPLLVSVDFLQPPEMDGSLFDLPLVNTVRLTKITHKVIQTNSSFKSLSPVCGYAFFHGALVYFGILSICRKQEVRENCLLCINSFYQALEAITVPYRPMKKAFDYLSLLQKKFNTEVAAHLSAANTYLEPCISMDEFKPSYYAAPTPHLEDTPKRNRRAYSTDAYAHSAVNARQGAEPYRSAMSMSPNVYCSAPMTLSYFNMMNTLPLSVSLGPWPTQGIVSGNSGYSPSQSVASSSRISPMVAIPPQSALPYIRESLQSPATLPQELSDMHQFQYYDNTETPSYEASFYGSVVNTPMYEDEKAMIASVPSALLMTNPATALRQSPFSSSYGVSKEACLATQELVPFDLINEGETLEIDEASNQDTAMFMGPDSNISPSGHDHVLLKKAISNSSVSSGVTITYTSAPTSSFSHAHTRESPKQQKQPLRSNAPNFIPIPKSYLKPEEILPGHKQQ